MFDGVVQVSFRMENKDSIAGFVLRYIDIFNHYGIIVDMELKQISFYDTN